MTIERMRNKLANSVKKGIYIYTKEMSEGTLKSKGIPGFPLSLSLRYKREIRPADKSKVNAQKSVKEEKHIVP